ncbi:recombinase family protein [Tissierella praeacuta]|uniref:recombinase family protein n=1 Tax=Tissierella praeacuta TaxID=43131 RepID=UPI00334233D1
MKAVGYIRVSTSKFEQEDSLENQKNLFLQFIKDQGFTFAGVYIDVESGTTTNRPEFLRMLEDAKKKKFDVIIVKELSRLSRDAKVSYELENILQELNIDLITLDNAINTITGNKQLFGLYAWFSQNESQTTSNRVKDAFKSKYRNGEFVGSTPPYGYKLKDKKLYLKTDETVEVVKWIFEKFINGWGYHKIAKTLTEKGHPTPARIAGKRNAGLYWHSTTIQKILQNPHYKGDLVQNRETTISVVNKKRKQIKPEDMIIIENTHQAIISKEDFEKVQRLITSKKAKGRGKIKEQRHLFTNLIFCSDCGGGLWYRQNRQGYMCGKHIKHGKIACTQHYVREDDLKELILEDIRQVSEKLSSDKILNKFKVKIEKNEKGSKGKIKKIEIEIERLTNRKNSLLDNLLDGTIAKEDYKNKDEELTKNINKLELEKSELQKQNPNDVIEKLNSFKSEIEEALKFSEITNEILTQLVEKVEVEENGSVKIYYKFADPSASNFLAS